MKQKNVFGLIAIDSINKVLYLGRGQCMFLEGQTIQSKANQKKIFLPLI